MSLELKIEALTAAVVALTAKLESSNVAAPAPVAPTPAPVVQASPAPVAAPVAAAPVAAPAPAMPAPPSFVAPAPAPAPTGAPFSDGKGLIDYVMSAYKALGPQKGALIQGVLTGMGYQNINDVKPEHYGQLFAGVEALK
jgi:2-oxoglutarate dehydrogenase E2 component (dihydrolipoamide succinyltransferase)